MLLRATREEPVLYWAERINTWEGNYAVRLFGLSILSVV
jgi:hypothetical protein